MADFKGYAPTFDNEEILRHSLRVLAGGSIKIKDEASYEVALDGIVNNLSENGKKIFDSLGERIKTEKAVHVVK